jgi:hypothetical protein
LEVCFLALERGKEGGNKTNWSASFFLVSFYSTTNSMKIFSVVIYNLLES